MTFDEWLKQGIMARKPEWFGGVKLAVNDKPPKIGINSQETKPLSDLRAFEEPVQDRMSKASGDDWDDWDGVETEDYTEVVE